MLLPQLFIFPLHQSLSLSFPTFNSLPDCLDTNYVCFISHLQQSPILFVHKLRLFYFPPSTVSPQTVEAIYQCAEMLTQTFKSDLFLNIFTILLYILVILYYTIDIILIGKTN